MNRSISSGLSGLLLASGLALSSNISDVYAQDINLGVNCIDNIQRDLSCDIGPVKDLMHQIYGAEFLTTAGFSDEQLLEGFTTGRLSGNGIFPLITANEIATGCGDVPLSESLVCVTDYLKASTSTGPSDLRIRELVIDTGAALETSGLSFRDLVNGGSIDETPVENTYVASTDAPASRPTRIFVSAGGPGSVEDVYFDPVEPIVMASVDELPIEDAYVAPAASEPVADAYVAPVASEPVADAYVAPAVSALSPVASVTTPTSSDIEELQAAYSIVIPEDARVIWMDFDNPYLWDLAADVRVGNNDLVLDTKVTFCSPRKDMLDTTETNNELAQFNHDFYTGPLANHFKAEGKSGLEALVIRVGESFLSDAITHIEGAEHCYDVIVRITPDSVLGDNIGSVLKEEGIPQIPVLIPGVYTGCDVANIAPTVSVNDVTVYAGELASGRIQSNDPDKGPNDLTTELTGNPFGLVLYDHDSKWEWQTTLEDVDDHIMTVSVYDGADYDDTDFTVRVLPPIPGEDLVVEDSRPTPTPGTDPTPGLEGMLTGGSLTINQEGCGNVVILPNGETIVDGTTYAPGTLPTIEIDCSHIYNNINGDGTSPIPEDAPTTDDPRDPNTQAWMNLSRFRLSAGAGLNYMNLEESQGNETYRTLTTLEPFISPSLTIPLAKIKSSEGSTLVPFISGEYSRAWDLGDTPGLTQAYQGDIGIELLTKSFNFGVEGGLSIYNSDSVDEAGDISTTHSVSGMPLHFAGRLSAPYFFASAGLTKGTLNDSMDITVGDSTQEHSADLTYQNANARVGTWLAGSKRMIAPYLGLRTSGDDVLGSIGEQNFRNLDLGLGIESEIQIGNSPFTLGADLSWYPYSTSHTDNAEMDGTKACIGGKVNLTYTPGK